MIGEKANPYWATRRVLGNDPLIKTVYWRGAGWDSPAYSTGLMSREIAGSNPAPAITRLRMGSARLSSGVCRRLSHRVWVAPSGRSHAPGRPQGPVAQR